MITSILRDHNDPSAIGLMARLTLTFKDRTLQVLPIGNGETGIGRDADNTLQIDSLAVAPHHAIITHDENGLVIRQVDNNYPFWVNHQKVSEHRLQHGDHIVLGKHELHFADDDPLNPSRDQTISSSAETAASRPVGDAGLQVIKGKNLGLVIPLRSGLTRLGKDDKASAVIARRKDGYFLSALTEASDVRVNQTNAADGSIQLHKGDVIKVGDTMFQFFVE